MPNFLPEGFALVEVERDPIKVTLAHEDQPFVVQLKRLSPREFQSVAAQLQRSMPQGVRSGSKASEIAEERFISGFCRRVVIDWTGCTVANWQALDASGMKIEVDEELDGETVEIPYSVEALTHLWRAAWAADVSEPLLGALREKADEEAAEGND